MQQIILCSGIPASGKSFWAKELVRKEPNLWTRVCRDDLRNMLSNYVHSVENERLVTKIRNNIITTSLQSGRNVVIDETNLGSKNFKDVIKLVGKLNIEATITEKLFYIPLEEAVARDALRIGTAQVGRAIVEKFWIKSGKEQFRFSVGKSEYVEKVNRVGKVIEQDKNLPSAIICDLDGTISLFNKIGEPEQYPGVHFRSPYDASKCDQDKVNEPVAATVKLFDKDGCRIIFCSGREELYRDQTVKFLDQLGISGYDLWMRATGDSRKDSIIKEEIYHREIEGKYNVMFSLDDRDQVVQLYRQILGIPCFQINYGDF